MLNKESIIFYMYDNLLAVCYMYIANVVINLIIHTFVYVHFDKHNHFQQGDFIFKILLIAYTCKKYVCCVYENHFVLSLSHVYFFLINGLKTLSLRFATWIEITERLVPTFINCKELFSIILLFMDRCAS